MSEPKIPARFLKVPRRSFVYGQLSDAQVKEIMNLAGARAGAQVVLHMATSVRDQPRMRDAAAVLAGLEKQMKKRLREMRVAAHVSEYSEKE